MMGEPFRSRWLEESENGEGPHPQNPQKGHASGGEHTFGGFGGTPVVPSHEITRRTRDQADWERWQWEDRGFVVVHSRLLGELVVLVRAPEVVIPESLRHLVQYALVELEYLDGADARTIRQAHATKRSFPGSEVVEGPGGEHHER